MAAHQVFDVHEPSQVGAVRRTAVLMAERLGFDETARGRLALVVTELGTNLARHAREGRLLLACHEGPAGAAIEVLSLDSGPGMADLDGCLRDGFSSSTTPGTGSGAVRRLADEFSAYSTMPGGTVIMARIVLLPRPPGTAPTARFSHGVVSTAANREARCGDASMLAQRNGRAAVMVVDGLGHGPEAERAAAVAIAAFESAPFDASAATLARAHEAMRATRGGSAAIAQLDIDGDGVTFCGAGNIAARLVSGIESRSFLCQHGTLGVQLGRMQEMSVPWPQHALLVMHSDGTSTRWDFRKTPGLLQCDPVVIAGWLIREYVRGRDDALVVVRRTAKGEFPARRSLEAAG